MQGNEKLRRSERREWWRDGLAGGALLLLILAFFWRTLSGDVFQPADGGDLVSFLFPTYRFAAAELSAGRLPLWNPTLYGGAPFVGDIQAGFLYPPNLLLFLTNRTFPYTALQWLAVLHMFWAGLGMYALLRTLRWAGAGGELRPVSRPAALFAGLAFGLSDPLLIHLGNLNLIAVLSWLPWVLAAYTRALDSPSRRARWGWALLAAFLFTVSTYAGHAQSTLYIGLALALYTLGWVITNGWQQMWVRALTVGAAVLAGTLLLAAPILWPALEMARHTVRADFTYQDAVAYSLAPVQALIGLLTPGFFGRGPALHWSLWQRVELPYLGVTALILALAALLLSRPPLRRQLWGWLAIALFGLLVSLGVYGLLHGLLTLILPLFDQFRAPARALILWALGMSVLAAVGFDLVVNAAGQRFNAKALRFNAKAEKLNAKTQRGKGAKGLDTNVQATTSPSHPLTLSPSHPVTSSPRHPLTRSPAHVFDALLRWGAILLGFVALPLACLALLLTQGDETAFLRASLAALALALALICWLGTWATITARRRGAIGPHTAAALLIGLLFFDLAAAGAYTDISSSDPTQAFNHPEIVALLRGDPDLFRIDTDTDIADLWQPDTAALYGLQDVSGVANPLLLRSMRDFQQSTGGRGTRRYDLLNVKYVLVRAGTPLPEGKFERVLGPVGDLEVYANRDFAPRAWWTPADMDLANLELPDDPLAAQVTRYTSSALTVEVDAPADGYLILGETWYPGWQATVNGIDTPIEQVNGVFRAVPVPAGHSVVEMYYWPWTLGG